MTCRFPAASPTNTVNVPADSTGFDFTVYAGYKINFTARPQSGYVFVGWTGLEDVTTNPQIVEVGSGKTVTATSMLVLSVPAVPFGTLAASLSLLLVPRAWCCVVRGARERALR